MKNFSILLGLASFILVSTGNAQTTTTKKRKASFWNAVELSPTIGTIYTDYYIKPNDGTFKVDLTPLPGIAVGIEATFKTKNPFIDYQTGLIYSQSRIRQSTNYVFSTDDGSFRTESDSVSTVQVDRLSIPITARLFPWKKKSKFYLKGGVIVHNQIRLFIEGSSTTKSKNGDEPTVIDSESRKGSIGGDDGLRTLVPDAIAGMGYLFKVTQAFGLSAELTYQRGLLGIANEDQNDGIPSTLYFRVGATF